jgi:hypothetical protein
MKYIRVDAAPTELLDTETVVRLPNFMKEIELSKFQRGNRKVTTANMIRTTLIEIANKYDPTFEIYREFNASLYDGLAFDGDFGYSALILKIIAAVRPGIIDASLHRDIAEIAKQQQFEIIYFEAPDYKYSGAFTKYDIEQFDGPSIIKPPKSRTRQKYNTNTEKNADMQLNKE